MKKDIFITGIGTEIGKTMVSAIFVEALQADYWKPIQAGDLDNTDTDKVKALVSNQKTRFHPEAFALKTAMSPHASAEINGVSIKTENIHRPKTHNNVVIEGAGGVLVPLNSTETILDLILPTDFTIFVSRHYLGSINHTLLTIEALKQRKIERIGILFNGNEHPTTESIIEKMGGASIVGRIEEEEYFNKETVRKYAEKLRKPLFEFLSSIDGFGK